MCTFREKLFFAFILENMLFNPCKSKGGPRPPPPRKKIIPGGAPKPRTWPKSKKVLKYDIKNGNSSVYWHFASWKDKINLKVDSESHDLYLVPCQKAKQSDIYFSYNRCLKLAYFRRFRGRDDSSRKFVLVTLFDHTGVNFKKLLREEYIN
jgi:hypothetical protein